MMNKLAQTNPFGSITVPQSIGHFGSDPGVAFGKLIQFSLRTLVVVAGLYALFNLLFAGYSFMSAGDDSKKVAGAWAQIYQTILGLAVSAGSFVLAAIFGWLLFKNPFFLLQPILPTL